MSATDDYNKPKEIHITEPLTQTVARELKDTLFSVIFGTKEGGQQIYYAFTKKILPQGTPVTVIKLDSAVYSDKRNDIAFIIGNLIILFIEHQSSPAPNIPLRLFLYAALVYDRLITENGLEVYAEKRIQIPRPKFAVLYNGTRKQPAISELKLSDLYLPDEGLDSDMFGSMELTVKLYNINDPANDEIVKGSDLIFGFKFLVEKYYGYKEQGLIDEDAINRTIEDCEKNSVLTDLLSTKKGEIFGMLCTQYDNDKYIRSVAEVAAEVAAEEAREKANKEKQALIDSFAELGIPPDMIAKAKARAESRISQYAG
jgi:hypothetical protein